jgi:hypothetical protein
LQIVRTVIFHFEVNPRWIFVMLPDLDPRRLKSYQVGMVGCPVSHESRATNTEPWLFRHWLTSPCSISIQTRLCWNTDAYLVVKSLARSPGISGVILVTIRSIRPHPTGPHTHT